MAQNVDLRPATPEDARHLAVLVNYAGEGMPLYLWTKAAAETDDPALKDPWAMGRMRAARQTGSFSYKNAVAAEVDGAFAGCLLVYGIGDAPEEIGPDMPPMFVPLQELENEALGSLYVNVLAVHPEFRGQGIGARLLAEAERIADGRALSIIVSDANEGAIRLYERTGYRRMASRPKVKDDWDGPGENWILMIKPA